MGWQPPGLQEVAAQVGDGRVKELDEVLEEVLLVFVDFVLVVFVFLPVVVVADVFFDEIFEVDDFVLVAFLV